MILLLLSGAAVAFIAAGLKGFQHKNVIHNKLKSVFFTSYFMALIDAVGISIIVKGGWVVGLATGTGAALGMIVAIKLHDRIFK